MLSKLFKGELSLKVTFWKFGVLGLIILSLAVKIFGALLLGHIKGVSIIEFYTRYFHPIYSSKLSILWTLCYLSSLLVLAVYSWQIVSAVWKSSAEYDKSVWLRHLSRLFILLTVVLVLGSVNFRPFF